MANERTQRVTLDDLFAIAQNGGPLLKGTSLRCPACEETADILGFTPLEYSVKYAEQIVVPLKCPACRHVFALRP